MALRNERRGTAAWCGRLLLFTALLVGIVSMHTLGHPTEDHGRPESATVSGERHAAPGTGAAVPGGAPSAADRAVPASGPGSGAEPGERARPVEAGAGRAGDGAATDRHRARPDHPAPGEHAAAPLPAALAHPHGADHDSGHGAGGGHGGTDPLSVCLAVLAGTAALLSTVLLGAALRRAKGARTALARARTRASHALRPLPPPTTPRSRHLARLSVLRL